MPRTDVESGSTIEDEEESVIFDEQDNFTIEPAQQGATLLPGPAASLISGITGISSFSLRAGTKIGGWGLYAGREATLKTLSVSRIALESILSVAGHDVASRGYGGLGEVEAMNILEKSISALHSTISTISFMASTGFYLTEASMNSISGLSIQGLATLNAILGSTESSRAVAAIITLIRNELKKPEPGSQGEVVSNIDLIYGTIGFVFLQRWGRQKTELDFRESGGEESIWDTVIDDKGFRADVVGTRRQELVNFHAKTGSTALPFASPIEEDDLEVLEKSTLFGATQAVTLTAEDQTRLSDDDIRESIMQQLPPGARAVITSETITAKTIKVDIYDTETAHIEAPPGTVMVAERLNHDNGDRPETHLGPHQTVIFRTALNRSSNAQIEPHEQPRLTEEIATEKNPEHADVDDLLMMDAGKRRSARFDLNPRFEDSPTEDSDVEKSNREWTTSNSKITGPVANEKKSRRPVPSTKIPSPNTKGSVRSHQLKASKEKSNSSTKSEKDGVIKKALKTLSPSQSSTAIKDFHNSIGHKKSTPSKPLPELPNRVTMTSSKENRPRNSFGYTPLASPSVLATPQPNSSSSYFTVHESRRDSTLSQTETYSVHSIESRPGSPALTRTQSRVLSGLTHTKSEVGLALKSPEARLDSSSSTYLHHHHRSRSFAPSLYSMATKDSGEAIILVPKTPIHRKSIYEDQKMLTALMSEGKVPGIFPDRHLAQTIRRFSKFATASYGSNFLHMMGLKSMEQSLNKSTELTTLDVHQEHSSFSSHTGLPPDTILLSSFFDPKGVTGNTEMSSAAISPLIHFISIDHDSKAVVLTCRGTLGFEDVLTDMTCDFDDLVYQGHAYKVHKGIHASARRMLGGSGSRVMATIKATLEEFPDYGLVLCGHSLGGAVAALVAILISEPCHDPSRSSFVTGSAPKLLASSSNANSKDYIPPIALPAGRSIHVYSFGTPATVSEPLRLATRGLITTIVNHADIFPSLSLGILHDFRTVALHLKHDTSNAIGMLKPRLWQRLKNGLNKAAFGDKGPPPPENIAGDGLGEDTWAWAALKTLRASMVNDKLVPPGEVFIIETTRVFDRLDPDVAHEAVFGPDYNKDDRSEKLYRALGRPATRVQFKLVRDVETRFGELRFGRDMFSDHSPGRYEAALSLLERGLCEN